MKILLHFLFYILTLLLQPFSIYSQAPYLGSTFNFALFTSVGAFSNDGLSVVSGDIGTNVGAFGGFPPGIVIGNVQLANPATATAASELLSAYGSLAALTCGSVLATTLGNNQILAPNIYCLGAASTLNGTLILDGQGNPDALFIFQIDGALSIAGFSNVELINSASLCNVYWQINGAVELGQSSNMKGNLLINGAIDFMDDASLIGRALTKEGAIALHNNQVNIGLPPIAAVITAASPLAFCLGGSVTLSGNIDGVWSTGETTSSIVVSGSGDYFVTNTTVCGSDTSNHLIVTVHALPSCAITGVSPICSSLSSTFCALPAAAAYAWSTGATSSCINVTTADHYTVTITDANGCTSSCSETLEINASTTCIITGPNAICGDQPTELCVPAGASTTVWSTGATSNCIIITNAGTYSVTTTDATGCVSICSRTVETQPLPTCTILGCDFVCLGGVTQLCAPPTAVSYVWSNSATTSCITSVAGAYALTITDIAGCQNNCSHTITSHIPPNCTITGNNYVCVPGETTELCVTPGYFSYLWSTGAVTPCLTVSVSGTYAVTVTDLVGCSSICSQNVVVNTSTTCSISGVDSLCAGTNGTLCVPEGSASYLWSQGGTTNCIVISTPGTYTVTTTSSSGCTTSCTRVVAPLLTPICAISGPDSLCAGGTIELCTTGGNCFLWNNGSMSACMTVTLPGVYAVTVTNTAGCTSICSKTIVEKLPIICAITGSDFVCQGQSSTLCATQGASAYLWSNGATTDCIAIQTAGTYTMSITDFGGCTSFCSKAILDTPVPNCIIAGSNVLCFPSLSTPLCIPITNANIMWSTGATTNCIAITDPGTYSVTISDPNGCQSTCSKTISIGDSPICSIEGSPYLCNNQTNFFCVPIYATSYAWSTGNTDQCMTTSTVGDYTVTITNVAGCSSSCSISVVPNPGIDCSITGNNTLCIGSTTEICAVVPSGSSIVWSTGAIASCMSATTAGTYSATITDANGCSNTCSKTIINQPSPLCLISGIDTICEGQSSQLCVNQSPMSTYHWSTGAFSACITVNTPGVYSVTVTSAEGCSSVCSKTIVSYDTPDCEITGITTICLGQPTLLCAIVDCTTLCPSYLWSNGATTSCVLAGLAAHYTVTVTNDKGCTSTCSSVVTLIDAPTCVISGNLTICNPGASTQLCAPLGAKYHWNTGAMTSCIQVNTPGIYTVTLTNSIGCMSFCSVEVVVSTLPACAISAETVVDCASTLLCAPAGASQYIWSTGSTDACIVGSVGSAYAITITDSNGCSISCTTDGTGLRAPKAPILVPQSTQNATETPNEHIEWNIDTDRTPSSETAKDSNEQAILLHPNPFKDIIQVEVLEAAKGKQVTLGLYGADGVKIDEYDFPIMQSTMSIDLAHRREGLYFLLVKINGSLYDTFKMVKL